MSDYLSKTELDELSVFEAKLLEAMNDEVLKMEKRYDFFNVADTVVRWLGDFKATHSEAVTQKLAEYICEFSVYDISNDAEWQTSVGDQIAELSDSDDYSSEELSEATRWLHSAFQLEHGAPRSKSTYLRLVDSKTANPVLEIRVW